MKLNLRCGNDIRAGYLNIDVFPSQVSPDLYRQGDIQSLDWVAENGAIDEIVATDCLQYINLISLKETVQNWAQKLQLDGVLKLQAIDMHMAASAFANNQLNLSEFASLVFGSQEQNDNRKSVMDMLTLCQLLESSGLTIELKRYSGLSLYVEAKK